MYRAGQQRHHRPDYLTIMRKQERYTHILGWFRENIPEAKTELDYDSPFHLLIAVMLSAQCTDRRVNLVTPPLFERFTDPDSLASATFEEVFSLVRSVTYPNAKSRHLIDMAKMLIERFDGQVPSDTDALVQLPGVGRKTANVIASIIFNEPVIAVDTHVFRVSKRLGLSDGKTVGAVEKELESNIPATNRAVAHHWLILHGRYVCTARNPHCEKCGLKDWCRKFLSDKRNTCKD